MLKIIKLQRTHKIFDIMKEYLFFCVFSSVSYNTYIHSITYIRSNFTLFSKSLSFVQIGRGKVGKNIFWVIWETSFADYFGLIFLTFFW